MTFDPEAVRAFEHAGWQHAAAEYDATFAHASGEFVDALLDAAGIGLGVRFLDVCCGTGIVTGAAAERGAVATGVDFSPAMLAEARRNYPTLHFDEGDAEALPYADAAFDAVVSNFGMHHVPRPEAALGEALRVLRPGGLFAFTAWAAPADNIAWRLLFDAIAAHGDPRAAKTPPSGGGLGSIDAMLRVLIGTGFVGGRAELISREGRVGDPRDIVHALARGTARTAALIAAQPGGSLPVIEDAVAAAAMPYRRDDGFAVPIVAILGQGVRPLR
jgi:SAM-dependent methyltransferase